MDYNIKDYLAKPKQHTTNVNDNYYPSKYNRDISTYCTSTVKTSISWGKIKVTTRIESYHEKFI